MLGPAAITSALVDLGAHVIKVEPPAGDYIRQMTWPIVDGVSLMHLHVNRGKRSVTLDLRSDAHRRNLTGRQKIPAGRRQPTGPVHRPVDRSVYGTGKRWTTCVVLWTRKIVGMKFCKSLVQRSRRPYKSLCHRRRGPRRGRLRQREESRLAGTRSGSTGLVTGIAPQVRRAIVEPMWRNRARPLHLIHGGASRHSAARMSDFPGPGQ